MKSRFLFPHVWRIIGYLCLVAFAVFGITLKVLHPEGFSIEPGQPVPLYHIIHDDIFILLLVLGLLFIAFAKEAIEDEQISQLRLDSLQWAIYVNYAIFILCVIFVNGIGFLEIVVHNVVTPLIIFIVRFRWKMYSLNRLVKNS